MSDDQEGDPRLHALEKLRGKAFHYGGSLGNVLSKSFELVHRVMKDGIESERVLNLALESLEQERSLSIRYQDNQISRLDELVYGLVDSVSVMIEGMMADRRTAQGLEPAPRISPTDSNTDTNDSLPVLFGRMVKEEVGESRREVAAPNDRPSTSRQTTFIKKPANAVPAPQSAEQSTSGHAARVQRTSDHLLKSAMRDSSTIRQTPASAYARSASVAVTQRGVRFSEAPSAMPPPTSTKRVRQESSTSDVKPSMPQPVSSFDLRARAMAEGQSTSNSAKRARSFVDYDEDSNDEWERGEPTAAGSAPFTPSSDRRKTFECQHCEKSFDTRQGIAVHMKMHNGVPCTICNFRMKPENLARHMAEKHRSWSKAAKRAASQPAASFDTDNEQMDVDVVGDDGDDAVATEAVAAAPAAWPCDRCDRVFNCKQGVDRHYLVHTGSQCTVCKKYMHTHLIDRHMDQKHNDGFRAPFPITSKRSASVFAYASDYYVADTDAEEESGEEEDEEYRPTGVPRGRSGRSRSVSVARPRPRAVSVAAPGLYPCDQCEKSFATYRGLAKHAPAHRKGPDNRTRYFCDQCDASRVCKSMLNSHRRDVHGVNPYECSCGESFDYKALLMEHSRSTGHARVQNSRQSVQPEDPADSRDTRAGTSYI